MSWNRFALPLFAALLLAGPASAQITGRPLELSGSAGLYTPAGEARMQSGGAYQGALGWRMLPGLTLEGHATFAASHADTVPNQPRNLSQFGLDFRFNLRDAEGHAVPYFLAGAGYGLDHTSGTPPEKLERLVPDLGFGLLQNMFNQRTYLRLEVRDILFKGRNSFEFGNHMFVTAGIQYVFGGKVHDSDLDGVRDWLDNCPGTPIGAKVTPQGCPIDSDHDGVFDGLDACPGTPPGCPVDAKGCSTDSDGDGICDGIDKCPDTPHGATVDAFGCPSDPDSDGVFDGLDKCPATPRGCTVDSTGCPKDTDGDGVCDGLDVCPNTLAGLRVDVHGCPIEVSSREIQLLDTGSIRLQNVQFDTGRSSVKPESFALLDSVGSVLVSYPTLLIEIGGHTDSRGDPQNNQTLSEARASAVLTYLEQKFPLLSPTQFSAKGYGAAVPVAPNSTALGRSRNRRVEFKVMNMGALKIERERRHFLLKSESAAPDSSRGH
ncbi:MAG: OmpA family protein [Candidatus Eiseniibacteriota bacterium]